MSAPGTRHSLHDPGRITREGATRTVELSFANGKGEHLTDLAIPLDRLGEGEGWTLLSLWGVYQVRVAVKLRDSSPSGKEQP